MGICVIRSVIRALGDVGVDPVEQIIIPGPSNFSDHLALLVDEEPGSARELQPQLQVLGQVAFRALPEAEPLLGHVVGEPDGRVVRLHAQAGAAPVEMNVNDDKGAVVLVGRQLFELLRSLDCLVEDLLLGRHI
eukprot:CAMPEP_0170483298 /NCGR_PEP_ID=MMETSP0208-20121228/2994_1 /TAXON_ID=197538 /ORGANISM="Strombidium inclinatum, Strain S3" /LENGTH=133 /DNA_ID=CAMNT_0010756281 /DNA_START=26 /DNA_END=427 /DNA_ORIENTATION=+